MSIDLSPEIRVSHKLIINIWQEMKSDREFERLCRESGLPSWYVDEAYEPRWYNGPRPDDVKVLFLMAEPGAITKNERKNLKPAISNEGWPAQDSVTEKQQENYWRKHLYQLCSEVWPEDTRAKMNQYLAGSCTFWASLPSNEEAKHRSINLNQTSQVPRRVADYFLKKYLGRFLAIFPASTIVVAAGLTKAKSRLDRLEEVTAVPVKQRVKTCIALTKPAATGKRAKESWSRVGREVRQMLERGDAV